MNEVEKYIADAPEHVRTRIYTALRKLRYIASEEGHSPCRCGGREYGEVCSNPCFCDWAKAVNFAINEMFLH